MPKLFSVAVLIFTTFCFQSHAQHISKKDFDNDWKFALDSVHDFSSSSADDSKWRKLNLPHDWSIEGSFSKDHPATEGGGALPGGIGWYRKTFSIPAADKGKQVFIEFDGVYRNSEVWINGHSLGTRPYGYSSFEYDLSPYLHYGNQPNLVAVKVDNSQQPNSRWYSGSGIYRNVWLTKVDKLHIANWGTFISTPKVSSQLAEVSILTNIQNAGSGSSSYQLITTVYDAANAVVGKTTTSSTSVASGKADVAQALKIVNPILWSLEKPHLYKAVSALWVNGKKLDEYHTSFGVRYFNFDADKGFSLNGKPVKILGVCNHHDLGALGAAINTRALQRQLEILKAMGCNGIRTSHNPPAPELLELCDKIGFIVMDESFDMWAKSKTKYDYSLNWDAWHKKDLEDFIKRDRNHPSVIIWSVGNEITEQYDRKDTSGRNIARELVGIVKSIDTSRLIVTANNDVGKDNNLIASGAFDLIGFNYHQESWPGFRTDFPGKKLIITESTSALETRGQYDLLPFDSIRRWPEAWDKPFVGGNAAQTVSAYDNVSAPWGSTHEESIKVLMAHDHISGMYIWTGFDYLGEPTPYSWPSRSSYFGIIDLAGFPKDVYYLYQSIFTNKPVLHIYPHWNWPQAPVGKKGDTVDVVCYYNNADAVELFLNGKSLGTQSKQGEDLHIKWRVPYTAGTLKAISRKAGKTVLETIVTTSSEPYKLLLEADRSAINADGKDLSFVKVTILDKNGIKVPGAGNKIQFSLVGEGAIEGVDNGDPVSHESFKGNQHKAMNGLALAIIRSTGKKGNITLTAKADGLQPATIVVKAD